MKALFEELACQICGGSMTRVSATKAVCFSNETHIRDLTPVSKPDTQNRSQTSD